MLHVLPKLLSVLALAAIVGRTVIGCAQEPPQQEPSGSSTLEETPLPLLEPIPYVLGADYRYTWILEGQEFATTTMILDTVKDADGGESLRLRGRLSYDRAGRILSGDSTLSFAGKDLRHPVRFKSALETGIPNMGSQLEEMAVRFEGNRASWSQRVGSTRFYNGTTEVQTPTWVLEGNCFEQWAIVAPFFKTIARDGTLSFYVPTGSTFSTYKIRHELTEGKGEDRRERWSISHPSQNAKLWTDASGRLVEYVQGQVQIVLSEVKLPEPKVEAAPPPAAGAGSKPGAGSQPEGSQPAGSKPAEAQKAGSGSP